MATKLEGGGRGKALVAGPLKKNNFFCGFPNKCLHSPHLTMENSGSAKRELTYNKCLQLSSYQ